MTGESISFRPTPEQYGFTFGGLEPVLTIDPGTTLTLWCEDAYGGRIRSTADVATTSLPTSDLNPQTGPFFINGAAPGDVVAIHLVDLTPARSWGVSTLIPYFGGLTSTPLNASLQPPLQERTWFYDYDSTTHTLGFAARASDFTVALPASMMLGTVGVAPAQREVRTSLVPDYFGGNMDTPEMRAGTTAFLRVNVEGALLSLGDGHYRQGEGESCGTAVEGAMNATIIVDLVKGSDVAESPAWPRLENDTHLMTVGSGRPLDAAWKASQVDMINWLGQLHRLHPLDAYQLLSQISETPLANVVDTNFSCVTKIDKRLLPRAAVFGDIHADLSARAAALGSITY